MFYTLHGAAHPVAVVSGFDMTLRDGTDWAGAMLQDLLKLSCVEVLPVPISGVAGLPMYGLPNPVVYMPQAGSTFTPNMVSGSRCCFTGKLSS